MSRSCIGFNCVGILYGMGSKQMIILYHRIAGSAKIEKYLYDKENRTERYQNGP